MKKIFRLFSLLIFVPFFTGCETNVIDGTPSNNTSSKTLKEVVVNCHFNLENYDFEGLYILTLADEKAIDESSFELSSYSCELPQIVLVTDEEENVIMLSRGYHSEGCDVVIDAHSTTIALVSMHPLLGPIVKEYDDLAEMIKGSEYYTPLYNEVDSCIANRKNLYDTSNDALMVALSNMLEDLCADVSDAIQTSRVSVATRARLALNSYPILVEANGNALTMRTTELSPSYYGTVVDPDGNTTEIGVKTKGDYLGFHYVKEQEGVEYGEPELYRFSKRGNYQFSLSRNNAKGWVDFGMQMFCNVLDLLGIEMVDNVRLLARDLVRDVFFDATDVRERSIVDYGIKIINWVGENALVPASGVADEVYGTKMKKYFKFLAGFLRFYDYFTGSANMASRITWWINSPEDISFCLCYYNDRIQSCTETELSLVSGDAQVGEAGKKLLLPLKVKVRTVNDNGVVLQGVYQKVKFSVTDGNGSVSSEFVGTDDEASVYWTLGDGESGDTQTVTAVVVDMATGEEISEPVTFTATLKKTSDITIRLDWHKLSGRTDIDLHVVDPFGEEIYYGHQRAASGGWLDRDDTVGPGPEHVYWEEAPAGTYLVKVHYYGSETKAVTTYQVTISVNGETKSCSGSLAYHQERTVATITIPETQTRGIPVFDFDQCYDVYEITYPAK